MNDTFFKKLRFGALIAGCALMIGQTATAEGNENRYARDYDKRYRVTIANATRGQPLAPGLIVTHGRRFSLFSIGDEPTLPLATMAETGDPGGLVASILDANTVDVLLGTSGPPGVLTLPAEANSIEITTDAKYLSAVGMLAATNDAFYGVRGVRLPRRGTVSYYANVYDAGSEANNEADGQIPATPSGNLDGVLGGDGEGYIHVHNGIHGVGYLTPAVHDWRNPAVKITIQRLHD